MKHKYAMFPFVMSGLALLCFLFLAFDMASAVQPLWGETMVLILPSLILALLGFFAYQGKLSLRTTQTLTVALSSILVIASFVYTIFLSVLTATTVTTDVTFYPRAYAQIDEEDGVTGIFPTTIPADAENIAFRYNPQFLQGSEWFELSYTTTVEVLSDWDSLLRHRAEWVGSYAEWRENHDGGGFQHEDALLYQLYWEDETHGEMAYANHGETAFVLIDLTRNQITFFYEDW